MMNSTTLYLVEGSAGRALNRRTFLLGGGALLWRRQSPFSVAVRLEAQPGVAGREIVSFGLPLPPGLLDDPDAIQVLNEDGRDVEVSVVPLETWRLGGREGSLRSVLIQAALDFEHEETRRLSVRLQVSSGKRISPLAPPADSIPRIWALLPPEWLCASEVAGPQVSASQSGNLADYDRLAERNFPGSLAFLDSPVYHHWLFDRTTCYYKLYIRTGELRYLEAAHRAASFVREHTRMDGPDAGCFTPKGPDVKYVYPRAMHLHYLLTGDERAHAAGEAMARFCLERWEPGYRPERYRPVSADVDPEAGREFWSPRHEAYGFLGVLHGWELTGREEYWRKSLAYADALYRHQTRPPDARPADGSFRQDWALYDPSESRLPGATSAWMSAILLDALFSYWRLSSDPRVPEMVVRFCDFLDRRGLVPDGSRAYYVIDCFGSEAAPEAPGPQDQGMERHNTEIAASFAMGIFFSRDREERQRFRGRFDRLFSGAARLDLNRPPRCFNWALQSSSQLVYFLKNAAALLLTLAFAHALPACSAERGAERAPTIETPAAEIEEYRILLRALGGGEDNERTRQQATARELLADRDLPAVLPELLRDDTAEQKRQLAKALGRTEDIRVVPFLIDLFPDDEIGLWVQSALAALGEPAAGELWAEIPVPPEAAAFPETGALPTTVARWCQGAFHQMGPRAVPFLVGKFRSGDSGDRRKALGILAWMHSSTFDLTDWREEVRADLHRALDAPDAATRLGALRVLAEIDEARAVESYGRRLQGDPDRHVALVAEGLVRDGGGRPPCLEEAARIRDLLGRGEIEPAKELMGEVIGVQKGFCDRDLAAALIPVLREEQRGAREAAIEGLGYTVSLSARRALGEAFRIEPDPELRVKILGAGVADPAATVLPLLDNRTPDEEALMIEMLGRERVREAVPALVRRLQHDTLALPAATALGSPPPCRLFSRRSSRRTRQTCSGGACCSGASRNAVASRLCRIWAASSSAEIPVCAPSRRAASRGSSRRSDG
jgi:HEAT repeat protein